MLDAHNIYEIEFDVPARNRESFEDWLSEDVVEWVSHETVAFFEVFQNDTGMSPEVKFVFGFETLKQWATFVGSDAHEAAIDSLSVLAENREAVLWQRASVKLDDTLDRPVGDGGTIRKNGRHSADAVLSQ
ncbi:hypothetical protein ACFQMA_09135 [Halosimplex aquaticum]|uniref:ABM domain-containing protein n=1 Tax=Halosimplex aquaticum TaxID=3026162 RepID=A0ABD5XZD6_9EURY|nr:hypothetical protein [Halosimplex aquaticum]